MTPFVDAFVNLSGTYPLLENDHFSIFYPYYYYFTKKTVKNKTDATVVSSKQMIMSKSADLVMEF